MNITRKELKLIEFAERILAMLESEKDWSDDTTDEIAMTAIDMGLAHTAPDGSFAIKEEFTA